MGILMKIAVIVLLLITSGCSFNSVAAEKDVVTTSLHSQMTVTVLDVGQGEAILVSKGTHNYLIDGGLTENAASLVTTLKDKGITELDAVIATHPHADHIGGLPLVLESFKVKKVYDTGQLTTSKIYQKYLRTIKEKKIPFQLLRSPGKIFIDEEGTEQAVYFEILFPEDKLLTDTRSDLNSNSAVMKLVYKNFSMLLTGDATSSTEKTILDKVPKNSLRVQVLKVAHHTSKYSSTAAWLNAVKPEVAIASYAKVNEYGFPPKQTLDRIAKVGAKFYNTADQGDIEVITDGQTYSVKTQK